MNNSYVSFQIKLFIEDVQFLIAKLKQQKQINQALTLMNFYSFNLINRILVIDHVRLVENKLQVNFKTNGNVNKLINLLKKSFSYQLQEKISFLNDFSIETYVLQKMLLNMIEPFYEMDLYSNGYGGRKGRNHYHFFGEFYNSVAVNQIKKSLLIIDLDSFLININSAFIQSIYVPNKFRYFVNHCINLKFKIIYKINQKSNYLVDFNQFELGLLFCNLILTNLCKNMYNKLSKVQKDKNKLISEFKLITYVNQLFFIFHDKHEDEIQFEINQFLIERNFSLNKIKVKLFRIGRQEFEFDFLGYTYAYLFLENLTVGMSIISEKVLMERQQSKERGTFILKPKQQDLRHYIKLLYYIFKNKNKSISFLIIILNKFIFKFSKYYSMGPINQYLHWFDNFIFDLFLFYLKKKFKKRNSLLIFKQHYTPMWTLYGYQKTKTYEKKIVIKLKKHSLIKQMAVHSKILTLEVKNSNYFLNKFLYDKRNIQIWESLAFYDVAKELHIKQKGLCFYCNSLIEYSYPLCGNIHYAYSIKDCKTEKQLKIRNLVENKMLLHRACLPLVIKEKNNTFKKKELFKCFEEID